MKRTQSHLSQQDPILYDLLNKESFRQSHTLNLIASENYISQAVREALASTTSNKYAEGYSNKRYYGGCEYIDAIEDLANSRLQKLFGVSHSNVQPHSGSNANVSVFLSVLKPGDTILSMSLDHGGHLSHGSKVHMSGKWYHIVHYYVREDGLISYDDIEILAKQHRPQMIIGGASSYSRSIDFEKISHIAKEVGAIFLADISHYAGLIVAGQYPSPVGFADIITSTTHKTLRGPRGAFILTSPEYFSTIQKGMFPGFQGGPLMNQIAARAVAFEEALQPDFKKYGEQMIKNSRALSTVFSTQGIPIVSGGTDSHIVLVDLRPLNISGREAQSVLENIGISSNKNMIPFDTASAMETSGIRFGSPALTTLGFKEESFISIGEIILYALRNKDSLSAQKEMAKKVQELCAQVDWEPYI